MGREPLRAIAFDLFHTLVDPEEYRPRDFHRAQAIAELLDLPTTEFAAFWNADLPSRLVSVRPSVVERVQGFCRARGLAPPDSVWPQVTDLLGRHQDRAILHPRPTVLTALHGLKEDGWTLGLLSNCDEREKRSWSSSELAPLFDAAVFSCEVGAAKPSPEAYRALVPRWGGIPLDRAAFVGDGAGDELGGARRAGFAKVVFQMGFVAKNGLRPSTENDRLRAEADASILDLGELASVLEGSSA